jgi:hypothetical protein
MKWTGSIYYPQAGLPPAGSGSTRDSIDFSPSGRANWFWARSKSKNDNNRAQNHEQHPEGEAARPVLHSALLRPRTG